MENSNGATPPIRPTVEVTYPGIERASAILGAVVSSGMVVTAGGVSVRFEAWNDQQAHTSIAQVRHALDAWEDWLARRAASRGQYMLAGGSNV